MLKSFTEQKLMKLFSIFKYCLSAKKCEKNISGIYLKNTYYEFEDEIVLWFKELFNRFIYINVKI